MPLIVRNLSYLAFSRRTSLSHIKYFFHSIIALLIFSSSFFLHATESTKSSPDEIVSLLQKGGYVLYMRHAATNHSEQDKDLRDLSKCHLQRNLSQQGKDKSELMGNAIKRLAIKIDEVLTSPYCRCVDTATLVFGKRVIEKGLRATYVENIKESEYLVNFLNAKLSETPKQGFNNVLIGHTSNLRETAQIWPKPEGVVHVFKPLESDGYQHVGHINPNQWSTLVR